MMCWFLLILMALFLNGYYLINVQVAQSIIFCQCYLSYMYNAVICHLAIILPISFLKHILLYTNESMSRHPVVRSWHSFNWGLH